MSTVAVHTFDDMVQKANEWLHELMTDLEWDDPGRAYAALRASLHALRDRLPLGEATQLGAQLPTVIRGIYFEGWRPSGTPLRMKTEQEFIDEVMREYRFALELDTRSVVRAVFRLLRKHISPGEITDVLQAMPMGIRNLWAS
jgi:uncharacterized protein (DUF2267 family)